MEIIIDDRYKEQWEKFKSDSKYKIYHQANFEDFVEESLEMELQLIEDSIQ